jgi:hypothetical protein
MGVEPRPERLLATIRAISESNTLRKEGEE